MGWNPVSGIAGAVKDVFTGISGQTKYNPKTPDELVQNQTRTGGEAQQQEARDQTQGTIGNFQNVQQTQQQPFASRLYARATGTGGPSAAELDSQKRLNQTQRAALSIANTGRGSHRGAAVSRAIDQGYRAAGELEEQAQVTRANEQLANEKAYADELGRIQGQNLTLVGAQQAQQAQDLDLAQLGQAEQLAILNSMIEEERLRAGIKQKNAQLGGAYSQELIKSGGAAAAGGAG